MFSSFSVFVYNEIKHSLPDILITTRLKSMSYKLKIVFQLRLHHRLCRDRSQTSFIITVTPPSLIIYLSAYLFITLNNKETLVK